MQSFEYNLSISTLTLPPTQTIYSQYSNQRDPYKRKSHYVIPLLYKLYGDFHFHILGKSQRPFNSLHDPCPAPRPPCPLPPQTPPLSPSLIPAPLVCLLFLGHWRHVLALGFLHWLFPLTVVVPASPRYMWRYTWKLMPPPSIYSNVTFLMRPLHFKLKPILTHISGPLCLTLLFFPMASHTEYTM